MEILTERRHRQHAQSTAYASYDQAMRVHAQRLQSDPESVAPMEWQRQLLQATCVALVVVHLLLLCTVAPIRLPPYLSTCVPPDF